VGGGRPDPARQVQVIDVRDLPDEPGCSDVRFARHWLSAVACPLRVRSGRGLSQHGEAVAFEYRFGGRRPSRPV
jgi:hypothetical protein